MMANEQNLKPFTGADDPRRVNGAPKGTKHLATHIQEMLNDDDFNTYIKHPTKGYIEFKGKPIKAIVHVAIRKAAGGDDKAMEWLAKHGYGTKQVIEIEGKPIDKILSKFGLEDDGENTEASQGASEERT